MATRQTSPSALRPEFRAGVLPNPNGVLLHAPSRSPKRENVVSSSEERRLESHPRAASPEPVLGPPWLGLRPVTGKPPGETLSTPVERRPTMRDVADLAGVGLKTVSRVVNREVEVSSSMAARVEAAIATLGYRRNMGASSLRRNGQPTLSIGLVLEDVANPFSSALHRAIENVCLEQGYLLFAGSSDEDPARERELLLAFCSRRVDGLIVVSAGGAHDFLDLERRAGIRIVYVDRPAPDDHNDSVLVDNFGGVRTGVRHLISHGHRRIAYLGDISSIWTATQRLSGYREELRAHDIAIDNRIVVTELRSPDATVTAVLDLMRTVSPPTAIFAGQNLITVGSVRALRKLDLDQSVALVGFDDFDLADVLRPAITVVTQDPREVGVTAAELLFRRLGGDTTAPGRIVLPTRLIRRGSGEIAPRGL